MNDSSAKMAHAADAATLPERELASLTSVLGFLQELGEQAQEALTAQDLAALEAALTPGHALLANFSQAGGETWHDFAMTQNYMCARSSLPFSMNCIRILTPDPRQLNALQRAVTLALAAYQFFISCFDGSLAPDRQARTGVLEMRLYQHLFAATRLPQPGKDAQILAHDWPAAGEPRSFIFAHRGRLFEIPLENATDSSGQRSALSKDALLLLMMQCVANDEAAVPVQLGTADGRDEWALWQQRLRTHSTNCASFARIERALFVLALDDQDSPQELNQLITLARDANHANRYYDKALQIIVFGNAEAAVNYDHAFADGANVSRFCADMFAKACAIAAPSVAGGSMGSTGSSAATTVNISKRLLRWVVNAHDHAHMARLAADCVQQCQQLRCATTTQVLPGFGLGAFAASGVSDDTCVQLALQLTCRQLYGQVLPVNEAIQMRHFRRGRYDTILCVTAQSRELAEAWQAQPRDALMWQRFRAAAASLRQRVKACKEGQGGVLLITTLFLLRAEAERLGQAQDGWQLAAFWQRHPQLHQALYCSVITSNPGAQDGVQMFAWPDINDSIGIPYIIFPNELCIHFLLLGKYAASLPRFQALFLDVMKELRDLVGAFGRGA
jgi:carnitine O-acetyltransferase